MTSYDYPLVTWINIGLHRDSLHAALESIRAGKPLDRSLTKEAPSNKKYLEKILREEVLKQFKDPRRPLLEVILNSVDAKPRNFDKQYEVDIRVGRYKFSAADNGRGMNPEDILRLLIIPFSSDKNPLEDIGRFGVGFLSTFNYCLKDPGNKVIVDTSAAEEHTLAQFYAAGKTVGDLRMSLRHENKTRKPGPSVTSKTRITEKAEMQLYIIEQLKGFPAYQARIMVNKCLVNEDDHGVWYSESVDFKLLGRDLTQEVGVKVYDIDLDKDLTDDILMQILHHPLIYLTSQGVNVKSVSSIGHGATISFPPAVQLVEGRDEFKIDANHRLAVQATFRALEKYVREKHMLARKITPDAFIELTELIPSVMSALEMKKLEEIKNIEELCSILLPGKEYVMTTSAYKNTRPFFDASFEELSFPTSTTALSYWQELFKGHDLLLRELITTTAASLTPNEFEEELMENQYELQNLQHLSAIVSKVSEIVQKYRRIKLVEVPQYGESALYFSEDQCDLYINLLHPHAQGERNPLKIYSILSDYFSHHTARNKHGFKKAEEAEKELHQQLGTMSGIPAVWWQRRGERQYR